MRHLEDVIVSGEKLLVGHYGEFADVGRIGDDPEPHLLFLLAGIDGAEREFVEALVDDGVCELETVSVLFHRLGIHRELVKAYGVFVLYVPAGALGGGTAPLGAVLRGIEHLDMLQERSETPQGICLPVIHVHMERIGLSRLVVFR